MALSLSHYIYNADYAPLSMEKDEYGRTSYWGRFGFNPSALCDDKKALFIQDMENVALQMILLCKKYIQRLPDLNLCPKFLRMCDFTFDPNSKKINLLPDDALRARALADRKKNQEQYLLDEYIYIAPEVIIAAEKKTPMDKKTSLEKAYVYSVAAITHQIVTKLFSQTYLSIKFASFASKAEVGYIIPEQLEAYTIKHFLERSFEKDPEKRLGFKQACFALAPKLATLAKYVISESVSDPNKMKDLPLSSHSLIEIRAFV